MKIARLPTIDIHWREDGDPQGTPLVFANSLGTDLRLWDKLIARLPAAGYRYIRFDKRGHGLSACPDGPYSISDLTEDTSALIDHLGIEQCFFVGLSIGGMIGQMLAARRPELVRALVLSNTAAKMGDASMWEARIAAIRTGGIETLADPIMERWFSKDFLSTDEARLWRNMLIRTPKTGYIGCAQAIAGTDLSEETASLDLPVLGIAGSEDQASPPEMVRRTTDMIAGSRYREISGAGHLPCVEQPVAYQRLLTEFLVDTSNV